jgi:excisionase family DNA binding protein
MRRYGFLSVIEVAKRLRRHPELVRAWLRAGRLKGLMFGRSWVIRERDVVDFESRQPVRRKATARSRRKGRRP